MGAACTQQTKSPRKSFQFSSSTNDSTNTSSYSRRTLHSSRKKKRYYYSSRTPISSPSDFKPYSDNSVQKEGQFGRRMLLYHVTSEASAVLILADKRFIRGKAGFFGGGIYFAESPQDAKRKARFNGVVLSSVVEVGISLVVNDGNHKGSTFTSIQALGCDSVKGTCLTGNEWIVFNNAQAREINLVEGMTAKTCNDEKCARYQKDHFGDCGKECTYKYCLMYQKKHRAHCKNKKRKILWKHSNEQG